MLLPLLPIELVRNIQQFLAHNAANTIIRAYYRKSIFKIKLTEYFCSIRYHMFQYGYYKICILPTFVNNLRLASRFINCNDDDFFWGSIYINIQRTLSHEESLLNTSIIYPASIAYIHYLAYNLRLAIGGYLQYHY